MGLVSFKHSSNKSGGAARPGRREGQQGNNQSRSWSWLTSLLNKGVLGVLHNQIKFYVPFSACPESLDLTLSLCITQDGHSSYKIIFKKELFWGL